MIQELVLGQGYSLVVRHLIPGNFDFGRHIDYCYGGYYAGILLFHRFYQRAENIKVEG